MLDFGRFSKVLALWVIFPCQHKASVEFHEFLSRFSNFYILIGTNSYIGHDNEIKEE